MQSKSRLAIALLFALVLVSSCQKRTKKLIGVVPKATSHLFFMSVHAGVRDAGCDLGVEVLWNGPREETES
jgi:ABC-type sugar transport system substrate-binding protein